jgi:hypothetical protein
MSTAFEKRLATLAQQQFDKYRWLRENQDPLAGQIKAYWTELGLAFPNVAQPWSAVFVSWCVKQAGATAAQFMFSPQHSQFVNAAIANAKANDKAGTGVFMGRDVALYAPKMGDILQNNRGHGAYTFQYAATHRSYPSHSAIVMEVGVDSKGNYLRTIGGNESDSVGMKEVRLDANGLVKNAAGLYIAVVETLL